MKKIKYYKRAVRMLGERSRIEMTERHQRRCSRTKPHPPNNNKDLGTGGPIRVTGWGPGATTGVGIQREDCESSGVF